MSSFAKQQLRKSKKDERKEVKKRINAISRIMAELDAVAEKIVLNETEVITENNISEIASKYSDIKVEGFEQLLLLSKLEQLGKVNKEDILKDG